MNGDDDDDDDGGSSGCLTSLPAPAPVPETAVGPRQE